MNVATFNGRRLNWRGILALLLVPLLLAGGVLAGTWTFNDNLHRVQAAVVNNDEMVEINGQKVPLGRQLSAALVDSDRAQNFTWVLANESSAAAGLASGRYAAVVRIPSNFSAAATSYSGNGDGANQATVSIETSPVGGIAETALGQSVADAAAKSVNTGLTEAYLDHIYIGFNDMGKQFVTVADGARQLADGSVKLNDGVGQASSGTKQLADGLGQAADGGAKLKDGGVQLKSGGTQLASGAKALGDGLNTAMTQSEPMVDGGAKLKGAGGQLTSGMQQLADGMGQASAAAPQLKDAGTKITSGGTQLKAGSQGLADGASKLATGLDAYTGGVGQYVDGINSVVDPMLDFAKKMPDLTKVFDSVDGLMTGLPERTSALDAQVQKAVALLKGFGSDSDKLAASAAAASGKLASAQTVAAALASGDQTVACPESLKSVQGACAAYAQGVKAGAGQASQSLGTVDLSSVKTDAATLAGYQGQFADALDQASAGSAWLKGNAASIQSQWKALRQQIPAGTSPNDFLVGKLTQVKDGGTQLKAGGTQLSTGAHQLADGASQLNTGLGTYVDGVGQYVSGINQLVDKLPQMASGVAQLNTGLGQYVGGVDQFVDGALAFRTGIGTARDGAVTLSDGVGQYTGGVGQYVDGAGLLADGVAAAHDGSVKLSDGMVQLTDGSQQLSGGTVKLADGLSAGAKQIPSYNDTQRENLAMVVASPISTTSLDGLVTPAASVASLLAVLALWLGALATYALIRPVDPRNAASSSTTGRLVLRSLLPGWGVAAVQSVLVTALVAAFLNLAPLRTVQFGGVLLVAGLAFATVNHALAAWAGVWGRIAALAFMIVTGVTALTFSAPGVFDALRPISPLSPALDATHAVLTDHGPALMVVTLAGWFALALLASGYRILRSRTVSVKTLALQP